MDLLRQFQSKHGENKATTVLQVSEHTEGTEADIQDTESSEIASTDIPETPPPPIVVAPAIQEPDQREKKLDELIDQLRPLNRHWKIEWARGKKDVPIKALLHASSLWLSDDPDDWTAANDTIFQFTSPFGNKQICYRRSEKVAIPEIASSKRNSEAIYSEKS